MLMAGQILVFLVSRKHASQITAGINQTLVRRIVTMMGLGMTVIQMLMEMVFSMTEITALSSPILTSLTQTGTVQEMLVTTVLT